MPRPIPEPPPETMQTFPSSRSGRKTIGWVASCSSVNPQSRGALVGFSRCTRLFMLIPVQPEYRDAGDIAVRDAAQVVGQAEGRRPYLSLAGTPEKLRIDLVDHAQSGGAHRMPETLEAAVRLARNRAVAIVAAIENVRYGAPGV